ncbi:MAG: hypothetical protein A2V69_01060 [Candidatus Portnoybacteria bacterium RBG_13_40_8]|uniref:Uncharacterized protein n=1 Tax=Candidatus Portnoybacteria bacterium RBG_13_40_8 TaxID=1801990 RepID=A0A1G2F3X2_9BACT|nr:MAG: hypothetical protein A2V69_01060 [Candidatus Portnoybacteria bacterium RBG_13_40_8]
MINGPTFYTWRERVGSARSYINFAEKEGCYIPEFKNVREMVEWAEKEGDRGDDYANANE